MSSPGHSPEPGVRGRFDALPTPSAGVSSAFSLGRIICAMEGPYRPLDDEAMLQAADEVEEAVAAAAGGAAGGGVAEEVPPAPAAPAPPAGGAGLLLRAGRHRATVVPELASRLILAQTVGLGWLYRMYHGENRPGCRGGILADGMGLGKTVQSIVLIHTLLATLQACCSPAAPPLQLAFVPPHAAPCLALETLRLFFPQHDRSPFTSPQSSRSVATLAPRRPCLRSSPCDRAPRRPPPARRPRPIPQLFPRLALALALVPAPAPAQSSPSPK